MSKTEDEQTKRKSISITVSEETIERLNDMPQVNRSRFMEEATKEKMDELGY
jgi:post-segregation antitoxin (ccd killing protein)